MLLLLKVNWSPAMRSAISDIEVDHVDLEGTTFLAVPNHTLRPKVSRTHL